MSRITFRVECELADGELKELAGNLWTRGESALLKVLRKCDCANKRDIAHSVSHTLDAEERAAALKTLLDDGIIEAVPQSKGTKYRIANKHGGKK